MAHYNFSPLSPQDMDFLHWETPALQMHGSGVQIFDAAALATEHGGIDFEKIRGAYESVLHRVPLYRQKIAWTDGGRLAVWVDDPHFNLDYHVRHTALPRPGTDAQLKRLAARIMEHPLDRTRPLWEQWVVEGLEGNRFAMIGKYHHCMIDGTSGMDLLQLVLSRDPDWEIPEAPRYVPRPIPSAGELRRSVRRRRWELPLRALDGLRGFVWDAESPLEEVGRRLRALRDLARWKLAPASSTPLNGPVGPHRIFDWLAVPLDEVKAVRKQCGTSVNDVVLAIVTGAVREFMIARGLRPEGLDFRASTPVNVRGEGDRGRFGNRVAAWIVGLPVGVADPLEQLAQIHASTRDLKESNQAAGIDLVVALHEWIPMDIQALQKGTVNTFVSNVPGPQFPVHLLGCELLEIYAQAPLIENLGLVIVVMSYNGRLFWGFNGDYDRVPDLGDFVAAIGRSFRRLCKAAGVAAEAATR